MRPRDAPCANFLMSSRACSPRSRAVRTDARLRAQWLNGSTEEAASLIRLPARELFRHGAADPTNQIDLPA
jgi:hypothetical protein